MSAAESAEQLFRTLGEALSQDSQTRRRAEKNLRDAEEQPDFFASMVMIATATEEDAPENIRWLAAVCGKNAVNRSWRRRTHPNKVSDDERSYVCHMLLSALGEPNAPVSVQMSLWIARIARVDFPRHCPTLISDLCAAVSSPDPKCMSHALATLDMVFKQMTSRRLPTDKKAFYRVAPPAFQQLNEVLTVHIKSMMDNQAQAPSAAQFSFKIVVLCMKSLRRLIMFGFREIRDFPLVQSLFAKLVEMPDLFMRSVGGSQVQQRLTLLAAKLVRGVHERHPLDFNVFMPPFLDAYYQFLVSYDAAVSCDRICYHAARFLRNALQNPQYNLTAAAIREFRDHGQVSANEGESESASRCRQIVLSFYNEERINALIEVMISKVLVLTERELEIWADDPETLVRDEEAAEWNTENLRYECQEVFKVLLIYDKTRIAPMVLSLAESIPVDKPLLRDACYRAVGKAVYDLQDLFKFEVWLRGQLGPILQAPISPDLGHRIVQARSAWLVGQFVQQLSREARLAVYPLLVQLMSQMNGDRVIALTAVRTVQLLVEDMGFHGTDFAPFLAPCLASSFALIHSSETIETKRDLLTMITSLVDRSPMENVAPLVGSIVEALPSLWEQTGRAQARLDDAAAAAAAAAAANQEADDENDGAEAWDDRGNDGGENLMRVSIVLLLCAVLRKVGPHGLADTKMRQLVIPVVKYSTGLARGAGGLFMMEEGCELWAVVIAASDEYSADLAALFPQTAAILGVDFDSLKEVFRVLEGYALLGRDAFMRQYGAQMVDMIGHALENVRDRGCLAATDVLDLLIQLFPKDGVRFIAPVLRKIVQAAVSGSESKVVGAAYIGLVARATLLNIEDVERLVLDMNEQNIVLFMDAVLENVDAMFLMQRRKMATLALCGLGARYGGKSALVQQRIPGILNAVVQVLVEEASEAVGNGRKKSDFDNFVARLGEQENTTPLEESPKVLWLPEDRRRYNLQESDPVPRLDIRDACKSLMSALQSAGEPTYQSVLQATDSAIMKQLGSLMQTQQSSPQART